MSQLRNELINKMAPQSYQAIPFAYLLALDDDDSDEEKCPIDVL